MTKIKLWFIVSSLLLSNISQFNGAIIKIFAAKCIHKCLIVSNVLRAAAISIDNILSQPPHRTVYLKKVKDIVDELNRVEIARRSPYFDTFAKGLILDPDKQFFISIRPDTNKLELYAYNSPEESKPFSRDNILVLLESKKIIKKNQLCINISLTPKASFWLKNYTLAAIQGAKLKNLNREPFLKKITLSDKLLERHPVLRFFIEDPETGLLPQAEPNLYFHQLLLRIPETKLVAKSLFFKKKV